MSLGQSFHDYSPPGTSSISLSHPAIRYSDSEPADRAAKLNRELAAGKIKLEYREGNLGYLPSLLEHLGVKADSQVMVFSKTSGLASKISPSNPRALYFSDDVQVGYVRGGTGYEVVAFDPKLGSVFYTLDSQKTDKPQLDRRDDCLQCHYGPATLGVPGIMVASVYADQSGIPAFNLGQPVTDQRTPFADRWGGWYVTGTHGNQRHRGNAVSHDSRNPTLLDTEGSQNLTTLAGRFNPAGYLSAASDIVALMTLGHQTRMTNLLTRLNWEARTGAPVDDDLEATVTYMLFADEVPLLEPVKGVSTFTQTFPERGPRDKQGRSLRDFDLQKRLFRYPLSYMIYSPAFDGLPETVRAQLCRRVADVLTGKNDNPKFALLSSEDRRSILEILRDTKPEVLKP